MSGMRGRRPKGKSKSKGKVQRAKGKSEMPSAHLDGNMPLCYASGI